MSNYLFYIIPIASLITFLASLTIFLRPGANQYLKFFCLFLFFNLLLDTATSYYAWLGINNLFLNNLDTLLVISFELFLVRQIVASPKAKKIFLYILLTYPVLSVINIFLVQTSDVFHTMTYSLGSLLIVAACIYYFWELFQQKYSVNLTRQPGFWICSGLLFYYSCTFPLLGLSNLLQAYPKVILQNLLYILILLNIFLYLSFSIAFLCRLQTKST